MSKKRKDSLVIGRRITGIRPMTTEELAGRENRIDVFAPSFVIELVGGAKIFASRGKADIGVETLSTVTPEGEQVTLLAVMWKYG